MSGVGPELPPHLQQKIQQKRKRSVTPDQGDTGISTTPKASSKSPANCEKRRKPIGPCLPPTRLDERPSNDLAENSESSNDDDVGPAPPPASGSQVWDVSKLYNANW